MKEIFYDWLGYNTEIFYYLNNLGNYWFLPQILRCLSGVFNIENFAVYYLALCCFCYWYARPSSELNSLGKVRGGGWDFFITYNTLVHIGICYAVCGLTYAALKFSVNLPRPFCSLPFGTFETVINTADERCMSSFPSSHSGLALMAAILAWGYFNLFAKTCAILVAIMVAFSRIALAMHYPADIVYSYLIVLLVLGLSQVVFVIFKHNIIKYTGELIKKHFHL